MDINVEKIKEKALETIEKAKNLKDLDDIRVAYLGKKGEITAIMQKFRELSDEERKELGKAVNIVKGVIENEIKERQNDFNKFALTERLKLETIDVTLPSKKVGIGHLHPCLIRKNIYNFKLDS